MLPEECFTYIRVSTPGLHVSPPTSSIMCVCVCVRVCLCKVASWQPYLQVGLLVLLLVSRMFHLSRSFSLSLFIALSLFLSLSLFHSLSLWLPLSATNTEARPQSLAQSYKVSLIAALRAISYVYDTHVIFVVPLFACVILSVWLHVCNVAWMALLSS